MDTPATKHLNLSTSHLTGVAKLDIDVLKFGVGPVEPGA